MLPCYIVFITVVQNGRFLARYAAWLLLVHQQKLLGALPQQVGSAPDLMFVGKNFFPKNAGSFILPNLSVNVTCQSYSFATLPAEGYGQGQNSDFQIPLLFNRC